MVFGFLRLVDFLKFYGVWGRLYADCIFIYAMDDFALLRRLVHLPTGSRSGLPENTRTLVEF